MWLVEDEVSKSLPIPNHYGVDDFPIIIQDKRLDNFGTPEYSEPGAVALSAIRCWLTARKARMSKCPAAGCACACSTRLTRAAISCK
jgi:FtsP/CotA-like multicopper oxidase with cupredoxin domain